MSDNDDIKEIIVFDNNSNPLYMEMGYDKPNIKTPVDYSFKSINDFVHCADASYEELQYLCLGLATELERIKTREINHE